MKRGIYLKSEIKNVITFFTISFLWTWIAYFAIIFLNLSPYEGTGMILLIIGGCSPTFIGLIMAIITYNKEQKREFFRSIYQFKRINLKWFLFIALCFPIIFAISIGIDIFSGGSLPEMTNLKAIITNPIIFFPLVLLSFMSGPFSEELGWRGYALNPMLNHYGFIKTSIVMGIIWAVWHLPLYFMPETWHGQLGFQFAGFWLFILMHIGLSSMINLVYINTNRSTLSALLMHLFSNFTAQLLAVVSLNVELFRGLIIFIIGIVIFVYHNKKYGSKKIDKIL